MIVKNRLSVAVLLSMALATPAALARTFIFIDTPGDFVFINPGTGLISLTHTENGTGWVAEGSGTADYGWSEALAAVTVTGGAATIASRTTSGWVDFITVHGGIPGEIATITLGVTIVGTLDNGAQVDYLLDQEQARPEDDILKFKRTTYDGESVGVSETIFGDMEVIYGNTYRLRGSLDLNVQARNGEGAGVADFFGTAVLSHVILPEGAALVTDSGTSFPVPFCEIFCDGFED